MEILGVALAAVVVGGGCLWFAKYLSETVSPVAHNAVRVAGVLVIVVGLGRAASMALGGSDAGFTLPSCSAFGRAPLTQVAHSAADVRSACSARASDVSLETRGSICGCTEHAWREASSVDPDFAFGLDRPEVQGSEASLAAYQSAIGECARPRLAEWIRRECTAAQCEGNFHCGALCACVGRDASGSRSAQSLGELLAPRLRARGSAIDTEAAEREIESILEHSVDVCLARHGYAAPGR